MPFEKAPQPRPDKWEITYEDEDCISIWTYNKKKSPYGPIEVEYKYKRGYVHPGSKKKTLGQLVKEAKNKTLD